MIIVKPKFTMLCDENFTVLEDGAVAFDERIEAVGEAEQLRKRYPNARFFEYPDAVLAPAYRLSRRALTGGKRGRHRLCDKNHAA